MAAALFAVVAALSGCGGFNWNPWSGPQESKVSGTPPGAKAYGCEGGKRLLVRHASDAKSVMIIHPLGEFRLDRVASASGEQYSNGKTTLTVKDGEATLEEGAAVPFAKCKPEREP